MALFGSIRKRLVTLARSEQGMALPTAIFAMIASMGLASAAIMTSVDVQQGSHRDSDAKQAIAAADAGANVALLRLNRYTTSLTSSLPCLTVTAGSLTTSGTEADGWCPAVTGTVGDGSFSYRTTPFVSGGNLTVVSTGTSGEVSRRVATDMSIISVGNILEGEGVIGQSDIHLDNNADVRVSLGTNGNVTVDNNANVCGNVRHGVGKKAEFGNNATQCKGYGITEGNITLPPVTSFMPSNIATENSDYRLAFCTKTTPTKVPTGCQSDTYSSSWGSTQPWNPSTRTISTSNNASLTLGGGDYFICKLVIANNGHLIMANGTHVRLFFDTPENCGYKSGPVKQIDISNNADITSTGNQAKIGQYDVPGFYLLGSPTIETLVEWSNNSDTNELVVYAPQSDIKLANNAVYEGVIAGKSIEVKNNTVIKQESGFKPPEIGAIPLYQRDAYVECTGPTASPPDANC
jgi:hypothetical protein